MEDCQAGGRDWPSFRKRTAKKRLAKLEEENGQAGGRVWPSRGEDWPSPRRRLAKPKGKTKPKRETGHCGQARGVNWPRRRRRLAWLRATAEPRFQHQYSEGPDQALHQQDQALHQEDQALHQQDQALHKQDQTNAVLSAPKVIDTSFMRRHFLLQSGIIEAGFCL